MIVSFGDRVTEDLYHNRPTRRARRLLHDVIGSALVKLDMLNAASTVIDLRSPPGNRLEALKGDLDGFHSIRVSDQGRVVFRWESNNAYDVRLTDYHD